MLTAVETDLGDRDWQVLLRSIERGNCVLLLGQDLDVAAEDGAVRNLSMELAQNLAKILADENGVEVPEPRNLGLVAQAFQHEQNDRDYLEIAVERFFNSYHQQLPTLKSEAFENLAALPFHMIVTSRFDDTLRYFLSQSNYRGQPKAPRTESYEFKGSLRENLVFLGSPEEPLIYQLFGSHEKPESLVITENDRMEFLEAVVRGQPKLPTDLTNHFAGKNFLFVGFGLPHYHLRVLMHILGMGKSGLSFALESLSSNKLDDRRAGMFKEGVVFYQVAGYNKLRLMDTRLEHFLAELRQRWDAQAPADLPKPSPAAAPVAPPVRAGIDDDRPKVFISYSMENVDQARQIAEVLDRNGLDPWWDKEQLQAGDRYDVSLENAISEVVDFFVVLQSRELNGRLESYVRTEVRVALERYRKREDPFIFPVVLDSEAQRLEMLENERLQSVPVMDIEKDGTELARRIISVAREIARKQRR